MSVINNPKSLAELTFKTIVDNVHCYGENLSRKLAPEPRQMVLEELLKKVRRGGFENIHDKAWLAFPSLLSRETKLIDTRALALMFVRNENVTHPRRNSKFPLSKVLQHLAVRAPNLQELDINHIIRRNCWLGHEEIASLSNLKNLSRLVISESFVPLSELNEIVKNCRSLQDVEVYKLELYGEEKVDFFDDGFLYHEIRFGSRFTAIRLDKNLPRTEHHFVGPGPHYHLVCFDIGRNLQFLDTQPHATALTINCSNFENEIEVVRFPRLPKLRSATFTGCEYQMHAFRIFLEEKGHLLRRLTIKPQWFSGSGMIAETLEKIFGWCSNLEWLSLQYVSLSSYNVPIGCLSQLRWFRCFNNSRDKRVDISSLLSAPQLEGFEIKICNLDLGNKETFFSRIAQKEILINLKRYKIDTFLEEDATDLLEDQLIAAIKSAIPDVEESSIL